MNDEDTPVTASRSRAKTPDAAALAASLQTAIQAMDTTAERSAAAIETMATAFESLSNELQAFREYQARERVLSVTPIADGNKGVLVVTSHGRVIKAKDSGDGFIRPRVLASLLSEV